MRALRLVIVYKRPLVCPRDLKAEIEKIFKNSKVGAEIWTAKTPALQLAPYTARPLKFLLELLIFFNLSYLNNTI